MSNRAYLLSLPTIKPTDSNDRTATILRYGNNIIPLFWWIMFRENNRQIHHLDCHDTKGTKQSIKITTLITNRIEIISSLESCIGCIKVLNTDANHWEEQVVAIIDELKKDTGSAIQLDCSELQMAVDDAEFEAWLAEGLEFSKALHTKKLSSVAQLPESLLDSSAIYSDGDRFECDDWQHSLIGAEPNSA